MLILAPELFNKLKDLGSAFHSGKVSKGALKKTEALLEEFDEEQLFGSNELDQTEPPTLLMDDVQFSYPEGFQLSHINFVAKPYEKIALIGATGSGKTTLLHILAGLVPHTNGSYLLGTIHLREIEASSWYDQMTLISQDGYLFAGTIAENISLGSKKKPTNEAVLNAATEAGIIEWIEQLPDGIHTLVGEGGRGLSGGERQRVFMARAFYKKPNVVFFDEPTTGLDLRTETMLQASLKKLSEQSTVIIVAHRLYTIREADRIYLLENGTIRASGTHETLWKEDDLYRIMITTQQGGTQA